MTSTLLARLRADHSNINRVLLRLEREADMMVHGHPEEAEVSLAILDYLKTYADEWHHHQEDVLFQHLLDLGIETAAIRTALAEHSVLRSRSDRLMQNLVMAEGKTRVPVGEIVEATSAYVSLQQRHMQFEEDRIFAVAERRLGPLDWHSLERSTPTPADPLFGATRDRFKMLYRTILEGGD